MSVIDERQREEEGNEPPSKRYKSASRLERVEERIRNKLQDVNESLSRLSMFLPRGPCPSSAPAKRLIATSEAVRNGRTPITKSLANDFEINLGVVLPLEFAEGHHEWNKDVYRFHRVRLDKHLHELRIAIEVYITEKENPSIDQIGTAPEEGSARDCEGNATSDESTLEVAERNHISKQFDYTALSSSGPLLSIYHPIYHTFMQRYAMPISPADITTTDISLAHFLVVRNSASYPNDEARLQALEPYFQHFLGYDTHIMERVYSGRRYWMVHGYNKTRCGLYEEATHGYKWMAKLILHVKNEFGSEAPGPDQQALRDYEMFCADPTVEKLRGVSCMPVFILSLYGQYLSISGAIYLNGVVAANLASVNIQPKVQSSQTDVFYTDPYDEFIWRIAHTFLVLRQCLSDLDLYYGGLREDPTMSLYSDSSLPAPSFKSFLTDKGEAQIMYIAHLLGNVRERRHIFIAEVNIGSEPSMDCVVKFSRQYGKRAHEIMEGAGVAPELLYCAWEESVGHWVVVMKYCEQDRRAVPSSEGLAQLQAGMQELHRQNLVHGDIREPNVLVDSTGHPRLIDFEWSHEVGTARYPVQLNPDTPWAKGMVPGGLILPEHDDEMLKLYLEEVR